MISIKDLNERLLKLEEDKIVLENELAIVKSENQALFNEVELLKQRLTVLESN